MTVNLDAVPWADPPGSGPNWYPSEFVPALPPVAEKEAQQAILPLTGQYALMRPRK